MSDAIKKLHDYLAKSPSVVYPEDILAYLPAIEDENTKLVDVLHEVETEAIYAYHCLQQDCVTTANSSEHFFKKWWHAECELDRARKENTKLRKLVADMLPFAEVGMDDSCVTRRCCLYEQCITTVGGKCLIEAHMLDRMRELRVEVDG